MALEKNDIHLSDGRVLTVTPSLFDKIAFESHLRANKRLGSLSENIILMQAFTAWSAARREHSLAVSWDQFLEGADSDQVHALDVVPYDDESDDAEVVDGVGEGMSADPLSS